MLLPVLLRHLRPGNQPNKLLGRPGTLEAPLLLLLLLALVLALRLWMLLIRRCADAAAWPALLLLPLLLLLLVGTTSLPARRMCWEACSS
jgi:hypothetical protein